MPKDDALVQTLSWKPLYCGIHEYPTPRQSLLDLHYEMELGIVCLGVVQRQCGDFRAELKSGEAWMCNMLEPHSEQIIKAPCKLAVFDFPPETMAGIFATARPSFDILSMFRMPPRERPRAGRQTKKELLRIARQLEQLADAEEGRRLLWVHAKLMEVMLLLQEDRQPQVSAPLCESPSRIIQGIQRVSQNTDRFVSAVEASKACSMSCNTFSNLFKKSMGMSFPKFAQGFRIRQAAMELLQTHRSAKQISDAWGFADVSHFHRSFIKYYGCTPKEYREQSKSRSLPA